MFAAPSPFSSTSSSLSGHVLDDARLQDGIEANGTLSGQLVAELGQRLDALERGRLKLISPNVTSESGMRPFSATHEGSVDPVRVGMRSGSEESKMRGPAARTTQAASRGLDEDLGDLFGDQ